MKTLSALLLLLAFISSPVRAQQLPLAAGTKHRVAFEVTMAGVEQWNGVLNNVENVRAALGAETEITVIAHSNGLGMLVAKENKLADRIKRLAEAGVVFAACENTMKKKNVRQEDLLPSAATVDSGVAEVVRKQEAGWSYIKNGS